MSGSPGDGPQIDPKADWDDEDGRGPFSNVMRVVIIIAFGPIFVGLGLYLRYEALHPTYFSFDGSTDDLQAANKIIIYGAIGTVLYSIAIMVLLNLPTPRG